MTKLALRPGSHSSWHAWTWPTAGLLILLAIAACSGDDGDQGPPGPPGPPGDPGTETDLSQGEELPGIGVAITALSGGTGPGGNFLAGNTITMRFRLTKDDGSDWDITEFASGRTLIAGPTFNYQRVVEQVSDVVTRAVEQSDGSYLYTFPAPLPATYVAPYNDTADFDETDGELTGQALLDGTYTIGLYFDWDFTLDGNGHDAAGQTTYDFLIGAAGAVTPRAVVSEANCNRCHADLQEHGGSRHGVTLCLLCHTAGSQDSTGADLSIDFKVLVHKIHAGKHLPSVLGVATNPDGSRNHDATPVPYVIGGTDYSAVSFPAWPHALVATPRDQGYTALSADHRAKEDEIRKGPSNCVVCHGDPDGVDGPLESPAQGGLAYSQPRRATCGACHDDVHWDLPYTSNGQTMPAIANDQNCILCHPATGVFAPGLLPTELAHLHPLLDPDFDEGVVLEVTSAVESGADDGDGTVDPGEKLELTFTLQNDAGVDIDPATVANPSIVVSGPTSNYNVLLNTSIPVAALTGPQPFTIHAPMLVQIERIGRSTAALGETFTSAFKPHWNVAGALTTVRVRTGAGASTTLAEAATAPQNYVDVVDAAGFARDDYVVVGDGGLDAEYLRVQQVDGNRLWFGALGSSSYEPSTELTHAVGAIVRVVTLVTKTETVDYTLNAVNGTVTEVTEFGVNAAVLATYTTDFVMPTIYPVTLNESPDLGETNGKWKGKSIVAGTYSVSVWTSKSLSLPLYGESNSYKSASDANLVDFLVGDALAIEPYALISGGFNCFNCHQDMAFHGFGRRGFDSCVVCHGAAGTEDRPPYVAGNAPPTTGVTINFRTMLHAIHSGSRLQNADEYEVVGHGSGSYPDNFSAHTYENVVFPAMPGGVSDCALCHGSDNTAWQNPSDRSHPTEQEAPIQRWTNVCGACHDSNDARGHIKSQTGPSGLEGCGVCHGPGETWDVERMHKTY